MAGLDGIKKELDPGDPMDKNIYELSPEDAAKVNTVPGSLDASLAALEADHDFLLEGGVFTQDLLDAWIGYKKEREIDPIRLRPHPYEYHLYFDL
jgi:glutamine synthetase